MERWRDGEVERWRCGRCGDVEMCRFEDVAIGGRTAN